MNIALNLTILHFEELIKKGYSLDLIFLLKCIEADKLFVEDINSIKVTNLISTLKRKGLVTEELVITPEGKDLINYLSTETAIKIVKKKAPTDAFDIWWKTYPATDTFEYKGRKFLGTRAFRAKKEDCKIKLNKILLEGEYTIEELVAALEFEVMQKLENSIKTNTNQLSFMQNSLTYLNQRTFEPFIELIKSGHKIKETQTVSGGTDI